MNYLASIGRMVSNVREFYNEINSATLTGAIDVVAVEGRDGELSASPFHVRFGKGSVLHSRDRVVDLAVNGHDVALQMKLGEGGEAFFVDELEDGDDSELPPNLATSPIPSSLEAMRDGVRQLRKEGTSQRDPSRSSSLARNALSDDADGPARHPHELAAHQQRSRRRRRARELRLEAAEGQRRRAQSWSSRIGSQRVPLPPADGQPSAKASSKRPSASKSAKSAKKAAKQAARKEKEQKRQSHSGDSDGKPVDDEPAVFTFDDIGTESNGTQTSTPSGSRGNLEFHAGAEESEEDEDARVEATLRAVAHSLPARDGFVVPFRAADYPKYSGFHPFSETDLTPDGSRDGSREREPDGLPAACKSDSELNRLGKDLTLEGLECPETMETEWKWGELPDSTPTGETGPSTMSPSAMSGPSFIPSHPAEAEDAASQGWGISNVLGFNQFMRQTKKVRHKPESEGIYLEELIEKNKIDPETASLYFPKSRRQSNARESRPAADGQPSSAYTTPHGSGGKFETQESRTEDYKTAPGSSADLQGMSSDASTPVAPEPAIPAALVNPEGGEPALEAGPPGPPQDGAGVPGDPGYSSSPGSLSGDPPKLLFDEGRIQELVVYDLAMSTCGGRVAQDDPDSLRRFRESAISYEAMNAQPGLLFNPDLVVRLNGNYYSGQVAMPMLVSVVAFKRPLSESALAELKAVHGEPSGPALAHSDSTPPHIDSPDSPDAQLPPQSAAETSAGRVSSWFYWGRASSADPPESPNPALSGSQPLSSTEGSREDLSPVDTRRYKKVLRLTSAQLKSLGLKPGMNEVRFSVTTRMQGTAFCLCHIYLWRWDDRIVISDIDGTITKSDVFGQILPQFGNQWAQAGVAQLYNRIANNGYKILYLSARAIGQASITKGYLKYVKQEEFYLPDGPLLLSPSSLLAAFQREVIEKKPEIFKKAALSDISALFPHGINPFYAGFGNKVNDVVAYQAARVPTSKIFTINHLGELRHELVKGMNTSYCELGDQFVDLYFPPMSVPDAEKAELEKKSESEASEPCLTRSSFPLPEQFSAYTFWRSDAPPHGELALDKFPPPK